MEVLGSNEENLILKNINLCVENLSKILSESCSNTLQDSSSIISIMNNNYNNNNNKQKESITEENTQYKV